MPDALENTPLIPRPPRPLWLLVTMIILSLGYAGLFVFSLLAAGMSPMVFDSGETARNTSAFFVIIFFPVLILISGALAWCGFGFRRYGFIPLGLALPVIYAVVFWFVYS